MNAKLAKVLAGIAMVVMLVTTLGIVSANAATETVVSKAPSLTGDNCVTGQDGVVKCYEPVEPLPGTGDSCPTGYAKGVDPAKPAECAKEIPGASRTEHRDWQITGYTCEPGYVLNGQTCTKDTSRYELAFQPKEYVCPVINWSYNGRNVQVPYEKSNDPNKCHRPSDSDLKNVYGMGNSERHAFKQAHGEWMDATVTYKDCSALGADWEDDPAVEHGCRLFVSSHDTKAATPVYGWGPWLDGACAADFLGIGKLCHVLPNCEERTITDPNTYEYAEVIPGTPASCPVDSESDGNGGCQKEVACPATEVPTEPPATEVPTEPPATEVPDIPVVVLPTPTPLDPAQSACEFVDAQMAKYYRYGSKDSRGFDPLNTTDFFKQKKAECEANKASHTGVPDGAGNPSWWQIIASWFGR